MKSQSLKIPTIVISSPNSWTALPTTAWGSRGNLHTWSRWRNLRSRRIPPICTLRPRTHPKWTLKRPHTLIINTQKLCNIRSNRCPVNIGIASLISINTAYSCFIEGWVRFHRVCLLVPGIGQVVAGAVFAEGLVFDTGEAGACVKPGEGAEG